MKKNSIVPLYQQLADEIRQKINSGQYMPGDRLLTEAELSQQFEVSRITVRKAIELLTEDGIVVRKQGIGTFVAEKKLHRVMNNQVLSFTEMSQMSGVNPSADLLSVAWETPSAAIQHHLHMNSKEKVLKVVRIRKNDGIPVMLETNYYPERMAFLLQENLSRSTYEIFRDRGIIPTHSVKTVEICYATDEEAEILGVAVNQAIMLQKDEVTDQNGEMIHFTKLLINSERYQLTIII